MSFNLRNRSLLTVQDYTPREFRYLLDLARDLKRAKYARTEQKHLDGQGNLPDLRKDVDAHALLRSRSRATTRARTSRTSTRPDRRSATRNRSRTRRASWAGCTTRSNTAARARTASKSLAEHAGVPVFNGLTAEYHPTQMLADVMTMREHSDKPITRDQVRVSWATRATTWATR